MTFVIDGHGVLRDPNLHDGFVYGIDLPNDRTLRVSLRDVRQQRFVMELTDLEALVCNDFRRGNIILDLTITSGSAPDMDLLRLLFDPPHPSAKEEFQDRYEQFLEHHAKRIRQGALSLVSPERSYGCWIVALCEKVTIVRSPD